jgi:hypothetical protein
MTTPPPLAIAVPALVASYAIGAALAVTRIRRRPAAA